MRCDGTGVGAGLGGAGLLKLLPEPLHEFKFSMTAAVAASATKARVRRNAVMGLLPTSTLATINPIVLLPTRNLTNSCTGGIVTVNGDSACWRIVVGSDAGCYSASTCFGTLLC